MSARRGDAPSLGVLVTGGIGVLVVVVFVGAIALGRDAKIGPGDRVAVVRDGGALRVLAARCPDERVEVVGLRGHDGDTLWRIVSEKGTIDRSFVVGAPPPAFFATETALRPIPPGTLEVEVSIDGVVDRERFDPAALEEGGGLIGVPCGGSDLGLVPLAFVVGGAGVVLAYVALVRRYLQAR